MNRLKAIEAATLMLLYTVAIVAMVAPHHGFAHELPESGQSSELSVIELDEKNTTNYTVLHHWVGGRLDRVTVERDNGIYEVYQNSDSMNNLWNADETELGHKNNVRQWRLGTW